MNTKRLISILQNIQDDAPFDVEVVTGEDIAPMPITGVEHRMQRTFIYFKSPEPEPGPPAMSYDERTLRKVITSLNKRFDVAEFMRESEEVEDWKLIPDLERILAPRH